ncbi:MAG: hypothetical protein WAR57_05140, partial [Candidatus Phosphoribacter sp.]
MPSTSLARGTLRVSYPGTHIPKPIPPGTADRAIGGNAVHATLLKSLQDNGFETVEEFRLDPARSRGLEPEGPGPVPVGQVDLELDIAGDEDAVVLVEKDGCYSWHLPTSSQQKTKTRSLPGEKRTALFHIEITRSPVPPGQRTRELTTGPRTRGIFGDLLSGVVRVVVMKFAAPWLVGQAISFLERDVEPGLIHLTAPDPSAWTPVATLDAIALPTDRPARVLLFIHGTFSSTTHAFGVLGCTDDGRALLGDLIAAYDAVIGFDHPTLSVDPLTNATDLLQRVRGGGDNVTFDVICHSRGGLTTRSFIEYALPTSGWSGTVDKVIFAAATNGGTNLANPDRWHDFIDVTTNLTTVGAGVLAALPGAAPVAAVIGGVIRGLGALVKYLTSYMFTEGGVPGLAAMTPGGPFVTDLNTAQPGQPAAGTAWYVLCSDFHVTLFDDSHNPPEFPKELAVRVAEGLVDQVFKGANDLVVDVESMSAIDQAGGRFVAGTLDFGSNDVVYHGNYFNQWQFSDAVRAWFLQPGWGRGELILAGAPREHLAMAEPPDDDVQMAEPPDDAVELAEPPDDDGQMAEPPAPPPPEPPSLPPAAEPPAATNGGPRPRRVTRGLEPVPPEAPA